MLALGVLALAGGCARNALGTGATAHDPCGQDNGGCATDASCAAGSDGSVQCTCNAGFSGDGHSCRAADPCAICGQFRACRIGADGSVRCEDPCANGGTSADGCPPPPPSCSRDNGGCDPNATCSQSDPTAAPQCTCKPGYDGDGHFCAALCMATSQPSGPAFGRCQTSTFVCSELTGAAFSDPAHAAQVCGNGVYSAGVSCDASMATGRCLTLCGSPDEQIVFYGDNVPTDLAQKDCVARAGTWLAL